MKKTSNFLSRMLLVVAFLGLAGTVSAQTGVLNAGGSSVNEYVDVVGDVFGTETSGFLAQLIKSPEFSVGVKNIYARNDVKIQSTGKGNVIVKLPGKLVAEGAYYAIYNTGGALLSKSDITSESVTVDAASVRDGNPVIIVVGTRKSGKLTSLKMVK